MSTGCRISWVIWWIVLCTYSVTQPTVQWRNALEWRIKWRYEESVSSKNYMYVRHVHIRFAGSYIYYNDFKSRLGARLTHRSYLAVIVGKFHTYIIPAQVCTYCTIDKYIQYKHIVRVTCTACVDQRHLKIIAEAPPLKHRQSQQYVSATDYRP